MTVKSSGAAEIGCVIDGNDNEAIKRMMMKKAIELIDLNLEFNLYPSYITEYIIFISVK